MSHYASKVLYTVDGWVEGNMDSVPQSFSETMLSSENKVSAVVWLGRCLLLLQLRRCLSFLSHRLLDLFSLSRDNGDRCLSRTEVKHGYDKP